MALFRCFSNHFEQLIQRVLVGFLLSAIPVFAFAQTEPPQFVTVDGRLYDSTNPTDPLLDANVSMRIQVLNPAKTCILYEEQQSVSTLANGYFNARVGSPTAGMDSLKRTGLDSGNAMSLVFQNQNLPIAGQTSGGLGCSYTPAPGESRYFRFIVTPSTTGVTSTLSPDMTIDSVPQSLVAETLQGFASDDFLQINANVTQAKANSLFGGSYAALTSLLSGTSTLYLQNTANGTVIPSRPSDPVAPSAGQIWYDSVTNELKYYDGTAVQTVGSGLDATKLPLAGGTMAGAIIMGSNDITSVGHITQSAQRTFRFGGFTAAQETTLLTTPPMVLGQQGTTWYNTDTDKVMYWDGVVAQELLTSTSANGLVPHCNPNESLEMSPGPTYVWSCVATTDSTKLALAGGALTGALTMNAQNQVRYADSDSSNYAAIQSPAAIGANYVLTLPIDDGTPGQVLQTDGNGILTWLSIPTAPVTSVFGRTGVVVAATSDYDANQIDNTPAGTISATDVQAALNELDTEKAIVARNIGTGANSGLSGGGNLSADRNLVVDITGTTALGTAADNADEVLIYDASGSVLRKVTRTQLNLSEAEVDAMVANNGYAADADKVNRAGDTMTGALNLDNEQELRLSEADGSGVNYVAIKSPTTLGANYTLTLPLDDGNNGQYLQTDGNGVLSWVTPAGVGETNTASNVTGSTGVGLFKQKSTFDLQFKSLLPGSTKLSVAGGADDVTLDVVEANIVHDNLSGFVANEHIDHSAVNIATAANSGLAGGGDITATRNLAVDITGTTALGAAADNADEVLIYDASGTALRKVTRAQLNLSETEVDAMVANNGYLSSEADTLSAVTGRGANTATNIVMDTQAQVRFSDSAGGEYAAIQAPATIGANYVLTLPVDNGGVGEVLSTDGNGVLSWIAIPSAPVTTVFGRNGAVVAVAGDYDANQIDNTPAGNIASTDVQAALNELDTEKAITTRNINTAANSGLAGGGDLSADRNLVVDITGTTALGAAADNLDEVLIYDASGTALRKVTRAQLNLSETEVDAMVANNGYAADADKVNRAGDTMTGALNLDNEQELRLSEADGSGANYVAIKSPTTLGANYTLTLPADDGTNGQVLSTDGNGVLSWIAAGTSITADSLNFTDLADALVLDASTDISATGTNVLSITNSGTGNSFRVNDEAGDTTPFIVDADGYVGIGTTAPTQLLTVSSGATTRISMVSTGGAGMFNSFGADPVNGPFYLWKDGNSFRFATAANDSGVGWNEWMRITSTGSVGIGTTAPGTLLDVSGAITSRPSGAGAGQTGQIIMRELAAGGTETATIRAPDALGASYALTLPVDDGTNGQVLSTDGNGVLSWIAAGTSITADSLNFTDLADALVLDASTDIAVGTNVLSVTNDGAGNTFVVNDNGPGDTTPFVIDASGNIGVGTATASTKLHVATSSNTVYAPTGAGISPSGSSGSVMVQNSSATNGTGSYLRFSTLNAASTDNTAYIGAISEAADSSPAIVFGSRDVGGVSSYSERMRVDSGGNVGIGTTEPGTILDVTGAITSRPRGTLTGETGQIIMRELAAGGTEAATIRAPDALGASYALTLPVDDGTPGQVLSTDGSGILSWIAPGSTITADSLNFTDFADALVLDASTDISATGTEVLSITNSGTGNSFVVNDQAADTSPFLVDNSGRVAIGTTVPAQTLDVRAPLALGASGTYARFSNSDKQRMLEFGQNNDASGTRATIQSTSGTANAEAGRTQNALMLNPMGGTVHVGARLSDFPDFADLQLWAPNQVVDSFGNFSIMTTSAQAADRGGQISLGGLVTATPTTLSAFAMISGRKENATINDSTGYLSLATSDIAGVGTEKMRINSIGNVGIGTTIPGTLLDVAGAITSRPRGTLTGQTGQIIMRELAAGGAETATIRAPDALGASYALTLPIDDGTSGQVLSTDGNGVLSWIAPGTSITADSLNFTDFADALVLDASTDISVTGTDVFSITNSGTGHSFLVNDSAGDTTPFVIDNAGNVGIGTTSPTTSLSFGGAVAHTVGVGRNSVANTDGNDLTIRAGSASLGATDKNGGDLILASGVSTGGYTSSYVYVEAGIDTGGSATADDPVQRVMSIGWESAGIPQIKIGNYTAFAEDSPFTISFQGSSTYSSSSVVKKYANSRDVPGFRAWNRSWGGFAVNALDVVNVDGNHQSAYMATVPTSGAAVHTPSIAFGSSSGQDAYTEKMRIDGSGNVGIGTTIPSTLLDIAGAITSRPNGTGTGQTGQIMLRELAAGGTETATIRAPDALAASYNLTLPVDDGTSGQVLQTNGSGVLSWVSAATSGGSFSAADGSSGSPSISFASDTDTGLRTNGSNNGFIGISSNGNDIAWLNTYYTTWLTRFGVSYNGSQYGTYLPSSIANYQPEMSTIYVHNNQGSIDSASGVLYEVGNGTNDQRAYTSAVATAAGHAPALVFGAQTGATAYNERMRIDSSGNLGVGTTIPSTLLDIAGAITSRPNGTGTGQTGQIMLRELAAGGTETATIRAPDALGASYNLTLPIDDGTSGQVLSTDGNGVLSWIAPGSTISADSLNFTDFADALVLDASTDISVTGTNVFSVTNSGSGNSFRVNDDTAADTTPFIIDASGNVGIGTTSASAALQVGDSTGFASPKQIYVGEFDSSGMSRPSYVGNWGESGGWGFGPEGGSATIRLGRVGGTNSDWDSAQDINFLVGARIGIGTSGIPTNTLHARASDAVTNTTTNLLRLEHESTGTPAANFGTGLLFTGESTTTSNQDMAQISSVWTTATHASRASALTFATVTAAGSLTERVRIEGSGAVGIGTTIPSTLLDIAGAITSRPNGTGTGQTGQILLRELAASPGGTDTVAIRAPDSIGTSYNLTLPVDDGTSGQVLQTDGNGILSWISPASSIADDGLNFDKLADALALDASTDIALDGAEILSITNIGTANSFVVNDQAGDTSPFVIDTNGNVGIGTTAAASKLEVNGRIVSSLGTDGDALTSLVVDFSAANVIDATGASAACGTLNITNTVSGGSFTVTIPNATATCTTIHWNGSATGVKLPAGYAGGVASSGLVYSFIHSGSLLWVTNVTY